MKELSTPADTIYSYKELFNNKACNFFVKRKFGGFVEELKNILVVDNHQNILELLSNLLQMYKYQTFCALDTNSALKLLEEEKVDCVVTDVEMPKPNGFDLLDEIKSRYPQVPVIMISSYANPKMEKQAHASGASGFAAKPFSIDTLQKMIVDALDKTEKTDKIPLVNV